MPQQTQQNPTALKKKKKKEREKKTLHGKARRPRR
jgi:hypothetical protein